MKLILFLFLLFSFLSYSEEYREYKKGKYTCTDKYEIYFKQNPQNLDAQYFYYSCLVIKGQDDKGLSQLDLLSQNRRHLLASDFLANYYETDGNLDNYFTETKVDEAIKYRMQSYKIIKDFPNYPSFDYEFFEIDNQYELNSVYKLPMLYLLKYILGFVGDRNKRLLQSPSY